MTALAEAIRIARRWAGQTGTITSGDMSYLLECLAALPDPDQPSDGDQIRAAFVDGYACGMEHDADLDTFEVGAEAAWQDEAPRLIPAPLPEGDVWRWESDGDGPPEQRSDQYVVVRNGVDRIATFHGGDAARNARLASCLPLLSTAARRALAAIDGEHYAEAGDALRAALETMRTRRSQ